MAATDFPLGHALAVQRWSLSLAIEAEVYQYFRKFMGTGDNNIIKIKTELNKQAGEKIIVGFRQKLAGDGTEGDNVIEGTSAEEALEFFSDSLFIDQRRKGTKSKGKMSEQRVPYNMRLQGRNALSVWYGEDYDQQLFYYLSGMRGITAGHVSTGWTGRANNSLQTPDSAHLVYGGNATSAATIDANDTMDLDLIERLVAKAETVDPMLQPVVMKGGENKFVLLMHNFQAYDLRKAVSTNDWVDIRKNTDGMDSLLYQNALGDYAGVILHKHRNVVRFDSTVGSYAVDGARALFLGGQAGMIAWGGGGTYGRYSWNEEKDDRGNALAITAGAIYGCKKTRFNSKDFGVFSVDTACTDLNA